jgi:DNA-binding beta-propeller fold protein YncE
MAYLLTPDPGCSKVDFGLCISHTNIKTQPLLQIKVVDPVKKTCTTLLGTGQPGCVDGDAGRVQFNEPGGLAISPDGSTLYVADTNSHAIRVVDLKSNTVSTVSMAHGKKYCKTFLS